MDSTGTKRSLGSTSGGGGVATGAGATAGVDSSRLHATNKMTAAVIRVFARFTYCKFRYGYIGRTRDIIIPAHAKEN